jgi:Tol biopolymer transport system component
MVEVKMRFGSRLWLSLLQVFGIVALASQCASPANPTAGPQATAENRFGLVHYSERQNSTGVVTGGLYLLDLETKEDRFLTPGRPLSLYTITLSWSPVAREVVYTGGSSMTDMELYLVDLEGRNIRLTDNSVEDSGAKWAPDGSRIAFNSRRSNGTLLKPYLMEPDGSDIQPVLEDSLVAVGEFAWSPDSHRLAVTTPIFQPDNSGSLANELYVVNVDTEETLLYLTHERSRSVLDWSPNGHEVVYTSDIIMENNYSVATTIRTLNIESGEEKELARFEVVTNPQWSPAGDAIAFTGGTLNERNVYLIHSDGTDLEKLTEDGFYSIGSWSPDGKKLALTSFGEDLAESELYVLDIETQALEQVTQNDTFDGHPIWVELDE